MTSNQTLDNLSDYQRALSLRIFDLVIGRVFKRVHLSLDTDGQKKIEQIFNSENNQEKEEFIKEYIPNFSELFEEETKKIEEEINSEIENKI
jgi:hypothetical protein